MCIQKGRWVFSEYAALWRERAIECLWHEVCSLHKLKKKKKKDEIIFISSLICWNCVEAPIHWSLAGSEATVDDLRCFMMLGVVWKGERSEVDRWEQSSRDIHMESYYLVLCGKKSGFLAHLANWSVFQTQHDSPQREFYPNYLGSTTCTHVLSSTLFKVGVCTTYKTYQPANPINQNYLLIGKIHDWIWTDWTIWQYMQHERIQGAGLSG